ncbi:MAG TPA: type II toxin-antitoxin system HicA family toxin [Rhodothermia bacterium]|nr:type II toxin-antitoxin system HicA family toxin [Rhodothermia bacterium]
MTRREKLVADVLGGRADANIDFDDLRGLLLLYGFDERTKGSHHLFRKSGIEERINLQHDGRNAKPYQVKQVRAVILKYNLAGNDE